MKNKRRKFQWSWLLIVMVMIMGGAAMSSDETATEPAERNLAMVEHSIEQESEISSEEIVELRMGPKTIPEPASTPLPTFPPASEEEERIELPQEDEIDTPAGITYVLNTNTKKFHYEYCKSVKQMKEKNKEYYTGTREECIEMRYEPCGNCKP